MRSIAMFLLGACSYQLGYALTRDWVGALAVGMIALFSYLLGYASAWNKREEKIKKDG